MIIFRAPYRVVAAVLLGLLCGCNGQTDVDEQDYVAQRDAALALVDSSKDTHEVLAALLAVHELRPEEAIVNYRLGRVYARMKLHEQALHHYEAAWLQNQDDMPTLLSIARLEIRLGLQDEAEAHLQPLLTDEALRGEALYELAIIRDQQGQRDKALDIVSALDGLSPEQAYRCVSLHGRFLFEQGDTAAAHERFSAALAGRGDYKEALKGRADSLRRLGRTDEADRWDRILGLIVELTDNVYMRSMEAADERIAVLEEVNAVYPEWIDGFRRLADLHLKLGQAEQACTTIDAFARSHPELPAAQVAGLRARYCVGPRP